MIPLSRILTGQRHTPVVYFARIGSNVKIGTTVNLRTRMRNLYVPLENVLAVVPGGKDEEDAYHERFEASRIHDDPRRELFRIDPQLRDFLHLGPEFRPQEERPLSAADGTLPAPLPVFPALPVVPNVPPKAVQVLLQLLATPEGTTASQAGAALRKSKGSGLDYLTALRKQGLAEMTGAGRGSRHRLTRTEEQS